MSIGESEKSNIIITYNKCHINTIKKKTKSKKNNKTPQPFKRSQFNLFDLPQNSPSPSTTSETQFSCTHTSCFSNPTSGL